MPTPRLQASWGGGGKGIRRVNSDEDVRLVFKQVLGEVPGSPVFTMKLAPQSRHLEVWLLSERIDLLRGSRPWYPAWATRVPTQK